MLIISNYFGLNESLFSVVQGMLYWIEDHLDGELSVDDVVKKSGYSRGYFQRKFNLATGYTISDYIFCRKMVVAADILQNTKLSVLKVSILLGYATQSAFSKAFRRHYGTPPSVYRLH